MVKYNIRASKAPLGTSGGETVKQLRRLHFAHGLPDAAASGSGSNEQTTTYDIKELGARISLPAGWYKDVLPCRNPTPLRAKAGSRRKESP